MLSYNTILFHSIILYKRVTTHSSSSTILSSLCKLSPNDCRQPVQNSIYGLCCSDITPTLSQSLETTPILVVHHWCFSWGSALVRTSATI